MQNSKPVIIIGAGDHAKVLLDILLEQNIIVIGLTDKNVAKKTLIYGTPVIGDDSVIPDGVSVGRNVVISGKTEAADYPEGKLSSGGYIVKAGEI